MLLGLEPGYRGQDERLDRSVLAAVLAFLGGGVSFLVAVTFLLFPEWISPRAFATLFRESTAQLQTLPPVAAVDVAWATSVGIRQVKIADSPDQSGEPAVEGAQSPDTAEKKAASTVKEPEPFGSPAREVGKATEGPKDEIAAPEITPPSAASTLPPREDEVASGCGTQSGACSSPIDGSPTGGEPSPGGNPASGRPQGESPPGNANGNGSGNEKGPLPGKAAPPGPGPAPEGPPPAKGH